jgi:fibrillarin-like pre-rRNA processing protein
MRIMQSSQEGIFELQKGKRRYLYTKSLTPGKKAYDEKTQKTAEGEFREFDPKRSKLAAAISKGIAKTGIKKGSVVLYLGAASGTTVSHVSDIVGKEGFIFAVEFSPLVLRELVYLSEDRKNIAPILADAAKPQDYKEFVTRADILFQDIAQHRQLEIFLKNLMFLDDDGYGILCIKARSIDISKKPRQIFQEIKKDLSKEVEIIDFRTLDPFEKDHCVFVCRKLA